MKRVLKFFAAAKSGKQVRILTNAMNTTDVLMVHAGYSKYRRELLNAGVNLYELKVKSDTKASTTANTQNLPLGLYKSSLHAKTFAIDSKQIFIGSFNFDPRSASLNCEMGFLIDSPTLASQVSDFFDGPVEHASYQPALTPENKMMWREAVKSGDAIVYQEEPEATWSKQVGMVIFGLLPIEWLL